MRVGSRSLLVVVALLVAGALAPPTSARRHHRAPAVTIRIRDAHQARVLRRGLSVRVRARRSGLVRVYAAVRLSRRRSVVATRIVTVRLRARRTRTVRLRLARAGRRALLGCARGRTLEVRAVRLRGRRRVPVRGTFRARRGLRLTVRCPAKGKPGGAGSAPAPKPIPFRADNADRCDPTDPSVCLLPFPNDLYTVPDRTTATGRRVNLNLLSMPSNRAGKPIDPADINRNDGFSPGSPIVTRVPGLDNPEAARRTGIVPLTDMARAYDTRQPVVVINARTGQRQLIWAELDSNPTDPSKVELVIHPGTNLDEGARYIVALRNLRDRAGRPLAAGTAFRLYRDHILTTNGTFEARRGHEESLFDSLARAGIDRDSLYLAWDFTVGSERSLSERQLSIRDAAFRQLGDTNLADRTVQGHAPPYTISKVTNFTPQQNDKIARQVEGTVTVPCYLNAPGCPTGSRFAFAPGSTHGPPVAIPGNTTEARFTCNVPRVALAQGGARPGLYGHGLFGSRGEVNQGQLQSLSQDHDFVFCATDWIGMACTDLPPTDPGSAQGVFSDLVLGLKPPLAPDCDVPTAIADESDLSNFPTLVDRVDQSFVNFMYLGRLMIHPQGFAANAAFQSGGHSVLDTRRLFYDGNSQGGIFGGSLIALEPDLDRGVIGVPGMNYSVLLQRSSDFGTGQPPNPNPTDPGSVLPEYAYPLYQAYPDQGQRELVLSLIQQMWDHSDPDGLAHHITSDPLPNTPPHTVLMHVGLGDHQVSQYTAETEARTIGARARLPWADPGRSPDGSTPYAIAPIPSYPWNGSAIVLWDIGPERTTRCGPGEKTCGTPPPPVTNTPPGRGEDPHEAPRNSAAARQQKSDFLRIDGHVVNVCGKRPCYAGSWTGP